MQIVYTTFLLSACGSKLESQLPSEKLLVHNGQRDGAHVLHSMLDALAKVREIPVDWAFVHNSTTYTRHQLWGLCYCDVHIGRIE